MIISIITINYNDKQGLEKTIKSVSKFSADCIHKVEYIIIDGGSDDGSMELAKRYLNKNDFMILDFVSEEDSGIYDAMNKGLRKVCSESDYVLFMNSGDVFLENAGRLISSKDFCNDIIVFGIESRDDKGNLIPIRKITQVEDIKSWPCFPHQSTFINATYHKNNCYNLDYRILADYNFFCEAYSNGLSIKVFPVAISDFNQDGISNNSKYLNLFINELKSVQINYFGKYSKMIVFPLYIKWILRSVPFFKGIEMTIRKIFFR